MKIVKGDAVQQNPGTEHLTLLDWSVAVSSPSSNAIGEAWHLLGIGEPACSRADSLNQPPDTTI
jgi:hypothetical protein